MGRHAQRRLAGGGPKTSGTSLLQIISVTIDGTGLLVTLTYSGTVDLIDFAATDFSTSPGNTEPDAVDQHASNQLELAFTSDVRAENFLKYIGGVPNILSPQVVSV